MGAADRRKSVTGRGSAGRRASAADRRKPSAASTEVPVQLDEAGNPQTSSSLWETAKGAGRTAIDLLSRPNYAMAGAAEELFSPQGGGGVAALKRAGSEIFSGIGPIKGQKEGFSEVMEQAGVGELGKLSDVVPFLFNETGEGAAFQRGGWADPTGRGALGLVGDIALDPTTYLTAGGKTASRFLTSKGMKYLSSEGRDVARNIGKEFAADLKVADGIADDVSRIKIRSAIDQAYREKVLAATEANPRMLDPTGIKWFGQEFVSRESLDGLSDTAKKVVLSLPGGERAARGAASMGRGIQRVFDPYADLIGLDKNTRDAMKGLLRENRSAAAMHKTKLFSQWAEIEPSWAAEAKKYGKKDAGAQTLGKKFADWREGTGTPDLTPSEVQLFGKIAKVYDDSEVIALREGLIDPEQAAKFSGKYLHHEYKNPEVLSETAKTMGRPPGQPIATEQFQRSREFDTLADAVRISRENNLETQAFRQVGMKGKVYGELIPEYDAMKNLGSYIQQFTDGVWRKRTYEEASSRFGLQLDDAFDAGRRYKLDAPSQLGALDRANIDRMLKGFPDGTPDLSDVMKLSSDGQREMARELVSRAKSPSQVVKIREALGERLMPDIKVNKVGDIDPYYAKYGQDGGLVNRSGGLWGEKEILIPNQIAKMVENAPRDIVMDQASKAGLQKAVKAWDWYNNAFKAVTYPFYPSGAVRDTYNNVMQAYLGIGVGAFARPTQAARVLRGDAADIIRLGEQDFTAKQLNTLAKDLGVIDPSGAAYVQFTGEQGAEKASTLSKLRAKRGQVDNVTRSQLFVNSIAAGMTPQDAAQVVKDFLFDYGELSAVDRDIIRRAIPFSVFPRKAIESYGRAAIRTPGRVVNLAKPFRGREDENNQLTSWEGEGFKLRLDRNGKDLTMLNGVDLPVRTLDTLWAGSPGKTMERMLSMASPAIKVPYEIVSGRDPFRGQKMGRSPAPTLGPAIELLPKWARTWAGHTNDRDAAGRPKHMVRTDRVQVLAEAALISRIFSTSDRALREHLREPNMAARFLDFLTGLRFKTVNMDEEWKRKEARARKIAEEEAVNQGTAREYKKVYVPR